MDEEKIEEVVEEKVKNKGGRKKGTKNRTIEQLEAEEKAKQREKARKERLKKKKEKAKEERELKRLEKEESKIECLCCGERKLPGEFYNSNSEMYKNLGKIPTCKDCLGKIYEDYKSKNNDDSKLAIYYFCRIIDVSFNEKCYLTALGQFENQKANTPLWKIYMTKMNSIGKNNGFGVTFDDSDNLNLKQAYLESIKASEETKTMWGDGLSDMEYKFLNEAYDELKKKYPTSKDSYAQELLFQDIAFQRLIIRKKRLKGDSVDKELKTLQDLLGSAYIKPAQEDASLNNETVNIGNLIKKFENERPIYDPVKEWVSKDWLGKYVRVWFFGNMCRLMGKKNPYQEEYEEEIGKYTVKPPEYNEEGEDDE